MMKLLDARLIHGFALRCTEIILTTTYCTLHTVTSRPAFFSGRCGSLIVHVILPWCKLGHTCYVFRYTGAPVPNGPRGGNPPIEGIRYSYSMAAWDLWSIITRA